MRLTSNQPSASSLITAGGPTSMTAQSAATTTQARFEAQSTTGAKSARQNYQSNAP